MSVISLNHVFAGYDKVDVIRDLSLTVEQGQIVALLGPNGAGKTTTVRVVCGELAAHQGTVSLFDQPVRVGRTYKLVRQGLSVLPADRGIVRSMSVRDNFRLRTTNRQAIDEMMSLFPALTDLLARRVALLSGGEQQMVALACALLLGPRALVIDEMSTGLAPLVVQGLLPSIRATSDKNGTAVLLVEQSTEAALEVADRAYVLRQGECVLEADAKSLLDDRELLAESYLGALGEHAE